MDAEGLGRKLLLTPSGVPRETPFQSLPPPVPGGVAQKFGSEKVSRYTGVSQLQLRVSRYTVQLSCDSIC